MQKKNFAGKVQKVKKEFIDDSIAKLRGRSNISNEAANARIAMLSGGTGAMSKRPMTTQRYIDIDNEELVQAQANEPAPIKGRRVDDVLREFSNAGILLSKSPQKNFSRHLRWCRLKFKWPKLQLEIVGSLKKKFIL